MEFFVGKVHENIMLMNRITCRFLGDFFIIIIICLFICLPKRPRILTIDTNHHGSRRYTEYVHFYNVVILYGIDE